MSGVKDPVRFYVLSRHGIKNHAVWIRIIIGYMHTCFTKNNVCHLKFINNIITSFKHHIVYHAVGESIKALGIAVLIKLIFLTSLSVHFHLNSADKVMLRQLRADGVLLTYSAINWQT